MNPLDCPALPGLIETIEPYLLAAVSIAAILMTVAWCDRTLRRLMPPKQVGSMILLAGAKLLTQLPVWAFVFVFLHLGGIGLDYRFGPCNPISRLANYSFVVIPTAMIVAQLFVDRHIYQRYHQRSRTDTRFVALHILSWLLVSPLAFILLSVLEFHVRTPI
jgi:hypothetical protein